jgi:type VI secretion system protein ImpG
VTRREPHLAPESTRRSGPRSTYVGSEIFVSLVDQNQSPLDHALKSISIDALCTNRVLATLLPLGGTSDFRPKASMPIEAIKALRSPTSPKMALAEGAASWPIISHLDVNYLTLNDSNAERGAQALRELLSIYAPLADLSIRKQIDAIVRVGVEPVIRRLPDKGQILMGRGVRIDLTVDENAFAGTSPFLLGAVLEQFFPRHVGQNSFTETVLHSIQRGEIGRWKLRMGKRPVA